MKFLGVKRYLLAMATTATAAILPNLSDLSVTTTNLPSTLIWNNLMYASGNVYIGDIRYKITSEPLLLVGGGDTTQFTSIHQALTGWQNPYIFPNYTKPIGFTVPHSAFTPGNATKYGFDAVSDGSASFLAWRGLQQWVACEDDIAPNTWQIWWDGTAGGAESEGCASVQLKIFPLETDCRLP